MWITHSLCSYVWKRQTQRKESCITAPEPLKHRPDSHKHCSTTPHLSQRFQCNAAVQRSEIQTRSPKDQFSNSHVLRGKTENPVSASQKLFRRLMISFVCAAELLSVCARYIRIINNINTFYWLGFLYWGEIHLLVKNSLREMTAGISYLSDLNRQSKYKDRHDTIQLMRHVHSLELKKHVKWQF